MLLVLPLYCFGSCTPRELEAGPAGLVGLGPTGLAPGLRCDVDDVTPGLSELTVLVGLLGDGDKWPQGPASVCKNLPIHYWTHSDLTDYTEIYRIEKKKCFGILQ